MSSLTATLPDQRADDPVVVMTPDRAGWQRYAYPLGPLIFSMPFMILAFLPRRLGFVSAEHSHVILDALLAHSTGALSHLGRNSSPLVSVVGYAFPYLLTLRILAAFAAGYATWVVWRQLSEVGLAPAVRALLIAGFATSPAVLFLSDAQASEMITLLLLLISWRLYLRFVGQGETWSGFAAGLVLALTFFCDFTSIAYVIPFAIAAPRALFRGVQVDPHDRFRAGVTAFLVIALPAIFALIAWCYVTWILSGNPFAFSDQVPQDGDLSLFSGTQRAWEAFLGDMARVPLYPLVALLLLARSRRTLVPYAFPLALTTIMRIVGSADGEAFTLAVYQGFALIGVVTVVARWPQRLRNTFAARAVRACVLSFLVLAGCVQLAVNTHMTLRSPEPARWHQTVLDGRPLADEQTSAHVAQVLSTQPAHSVLADDNAYKMIARYRTVTPYVLPTNARFELARSAPEDWVDHILVNTSPSAYDHLSQDFSGNVKDFYTDFEWPGWRLLTRVGAAPLADELVDSSS
jgi:hypothetical protein